MLKKEDILSVLEGYDLSKVTIATIGSHSALDICDGAFEEGFKTIAVCQKGREKTYTKYFKADYEKGKLISGFINEVLVLEKFEDIILEGSLKKLIAQNAIFIPNRALTSYVDIDIVEKKFRVPLLGSRNLLRTEEREEEKSYYWLLEKANLPYPEKIVNPKDINELVVVKLRHAVKKLERGFFTCASYEEYKKKASQLIAQNVITKEDLNWARIERYIIGPVFNLDFFYSPLSKRLELLGVDWRFETSLDGHVRLPAAQQLALSEKQFNPEYVVCGHNSATLRESLLEKAFELGERYVKATQGYYSPGIIGAFCLQTCVDKDLKFYIYDVAPRVGGGTNVHLAVGHPYSNALWRKPMSTGRRTALELKRGIELGRVKEIVT
ncbi:MAG: formate--phosphoribosylaminoimidazolecarboxamide ligase family protein [Candidatus Thermoplasmatota archaeon]|nr:formate--phosphoribosylaminoimidazolecarboxamide ligase family protein [Candidatus Thermoplasmatota archaeon]